MLDNILQTMSEVENAYLKMNEKEERGQFLGQIYNSEFVQLLKLRRDFLLREHDYLGQILYGFVDNRLIGSDGKGFEKIINRVKMLPEYNTMFVHYIPSLLLYFSTFDPALTGTDYSVEFDEAYKGYSILQESNEETWKLNYFRGALSLAMLAGFNGSCKAQTENNNRKLISNNISYEGSILDPARVAIDVGAIEFFMALALNVSKTHNKKHHFYEYGFLQKRVPNLKRLGELSNEILTILLKELERVVEAVITNLADVLKSIRLSEEDAILSARREGEVDESPGNDLEMFFIFISYLYSDRPNTSTKFWLDSESHLYRFITWGFESRITFALATLCDMLASLGYGDSCSMAVYEFLNEGGGEVANSKASWASIFGALEYYATQLKPISNPPKSFSSSTTPLVLATDMPELDGGAIYLLKSYFRLLTVVVTDNPTARLEFTTAFNGRHISTLFELLKCQTPLVGPILNTLAAFAETDNEAIRYPLWNLVDDWVFHTLVYQPDGTSISATMAPKDRLNHLFRTPNDIIGLITLLKSLMKPLQSNSIISQSFPFPQDVGYSYRYPGIWPYVDFIINEVFYSSPSFNTEERLFLQIPCLLFIQYSLELLDPDLTRLSSTLGINPDLIVRSSSFLNYLYNHPCSTTMSHLFTKNIYNILISICSIGIDEIHEMNTDEPLVKSIIYAIRIINDILDNQQIFLDVIVKEFKHGFPLTTTATLSDSTTAAAAATTTSPFQITSHGLKSFEDVLLFNLPTVTHIALYIGSPNIELAWNALQLFERLSLSSQFVTTSDSRVKKNRLLSALQTVDESVRIKKGFLEQLDRDIDSYDDSGTLSPIDIKLSILQFFIANLKSSKTEATIGHFLLGFRTTADDDELDLDDGICGIATEISCFNTILNLLEFGIENISSSNVDYELSKLSKFCIEIILLLVQNPLTSESILPLLRDRDFTISSLKLEPIINPYTRWNNQPISSRNHLTNSTVVSFFSHRASLLEYISLEIHKSSQLKSLSLISKYVDSLINLDINNNFAINNNDNSSAVMLSLLDVLEIPTEVNNISNTVLDETSISFFGSNVLQQIFQIINRPLDDNDDMDTINKSTISELTHLLKLKGLEYISTNKIKSLEDEEFKMSFANVINYISTSRSTSQIRQTQLECLKSWSKLALILVYDGNMSPTKRITFVLETFQTLIPKLSEYSASDTEFAEVLGNLLVSLQHIYRQDVEANNNTADYSRLHSLFRTSLESIQSPQSTPELRADLYMICYEYLKSLTESPKSTPYINQVIRASGDKLLEIICTDALSGHTMIRLVSLVFLEVLFSLSSRVESTLVQDGLVRHNLLLLLINSIRSMDQEITINRDSLTSTELFFELKVFNATLCFLLRVARTRSGASQLIQNGIFEVLDDCRFLSIDLDVGIDVSSEGTNGLKVSYYEIFVPVFQTLFAILFSMGQENEPVINRARAFIERHQATFVGIMKKDILTETGSINQDFKIQELVKLTMLLIHMTKFVPNI